MAAITDQNKTIERGSGLALVGPAVYWIENTIDLSGASVGATDVVDVFSPTGHDILVLNAIVEVETATTGATNGQLGDDTGGAATLCASVNLDSLGVTSGGQGLANVVVASGDNVILTLDTAAPALTGSVRIKLLVADLNNLDGS